MAIQALGYLGFGSDKLDDWTDFASGFVGMQAVDRGAKMRAFRMDDRKQRLIIDGDLADGERVFGWEVETASELDALAGRLEANGVRVARGAQALADQRCVTGLISFSDPAGNQLEAFHGAHVADAAFQPGRDIAGFRTGPQGMGHVLLMVPNFDETLAFYQQLLGFRITDFLRSPISACFLHVNSRHHSLALMAGPKSAMHHLMVELYAFDDVGLGYDVAQTRDDQVAVQLGRHQNDLVTSFYSRTPSDILVEYAWGGREVDDATWEPIELSPVPSYWGHQGLRESMAGKLTVQDTSTPPATQAAARRAPLQVIDGNYERMRGVCPWWDAQKR